MAANTVHRTCRVLLRLTPAQRRRCLELMQAAGDVRAMILDCNRQLRTWGLPPVVNFQALCREVTGISFGELPRICAEQELKRYSVEWFEAASRRAGGMTAGFPRRKRRLLPVRYRWGSFHLSGRRLRLSTSRGSEPLFVRLSRDIPYPPETVRSVTLVMQDRKLYLDVTAELAVVEQTGIDPKKIAAVDLGVIHPYSVVTEDEALLVSGRAIRAEERVHLEDLRRRARKMGRKAPRRGEAGSKRWRKLRARQRKAESRHRRWVRQTHHRAAGEVISWAAERKVGTLVIGDPQGITNKDSGRYQNRRLYAWRRTHLLQALIMKAEIVGIRVVLVDERGTSSACPECGLKNIKPQGRNFSCPQCGYLGHRDLVGARNIAARGGGKLAAPSRITHRRAGSPPARRDRRRHLWETQRSRPRSCPAPGRRRDSSRRSRSPGSSSDGSSVGRAPHLEVTQDPARIREPAPKPVHRL